MIKYVDTRVTFREIPDEVTLCINLSNCPHRCKGCHSPYLQEDVGNPLTIEKLDELLKENEGISCVCFMGGDSDIPFLTTLADHVRNSYSLKTGWYSGHSWHPTIDRPTSKCFNFIKTGEYREDQGPITSKTTNQRMYRISPKHGIEDITEIFWKPSEVE